MADKPGQGGKKCILDAMCLSEWFYDAPRSYIGLESTEAMEASRITTAKQPEDQWRRVYSVLRSSTSHWHTWRCGSMRRTRERDNPEHLQGALVERPPAGRRASDSLNLSDSSFYSIPRQSPELLGLRFSPVNHV